MSEILSIMAALLLAGQPAARLPGAAIALGPPLTDRIGPIGTAFPSRAISLNERLRLDTVAPSHRVRHAVIGGVIGAAAGVLVCTAISNLVKDSGDGFTTCDTKAYIVFGLGGAAAGALIGSRFK